MRHVPLSVARDQLSALISEVAHGKGRVVLESHGRPKAALVSMEDLRRLEPEIAAAVHPGAAMTSWLEQTERLLTTSGRGDASLDALREVREQRVAEDSGVYRRERRTEAGRRRKR